MQHDRKMTVAVEWVAAPYTRIACIYIYQYTQETPKKCHKFTDRISYCCTGRFSTFLFIIHFHGVVSQNIFLYFWCINCNEVTLEPDDI